MALCSKPGLLALPCSFRHWFGSYHRSDVAIKELRRERAGLSDLQKFLREAALMVQMRPHVNCVSFLGMCIEPKTVIVTEFMPHGSLRSLLDRRDVPLAFDVKLNILRDIARGCFHLELERIVHRDLAARNVLLGGTPDKYLAKGKPLFGWHAALLLNRVFVSSSGRLWIVSRV